MSSERLNLNRLQELISKKESYAFVIDYALFGSRQASLDGGFATQARIIPDFQASLDALLSKGFVVMKNGFRYAGEVRFPEVSVDVDKAKLLEFLSSFYGKL